MCRSVRAPRLTRPFVRLTTTEGLDRFLAEYPINITAPTDSSPFFFNMLRLRDVVRPELLDWQAESQRRPSPPQRFFSPP